MPRQLTKIAYVMSRSSGPPEGSRRRNRRWVGAETRANTKSNTKCQAGKLPKPKEGRQRVPCSKITRGENGSSKGLKKEMPNKEEYQDINSPTPGCNILAGDPAFLHTFHLLDQKRDYFVRAEFALVDVQIEFRKDVVAQQVYGRGGLVRLKEEE